MSLVKLQNVGVSFGSEYWELFDINFEIKAGSYIGLVGPNGAGKSTLLKVILGLIPVTKGTLTCKKNICMSYVPQKIGVDKTSNISVKEVLLMGVNCSFWNRVCGKCNKRMLDALDLVKLSKNTILEKNFNQLSGGQQQRVLIARSLISKPDLILFDEPLSGVDMSSKIKIYELLAELNQNTGVTIVFVSHEVESVVRSCKEILCLDRTIHTGCHPVDFILGKAGKKSKCKESNDSSIVSIHHHHN
jgi:zinc transport system ATP-binding protein